MTAQGFTSRAVCDSLRTRIHEYNLHEPYYPSHYQEGDELNLHLQTAWPEYRCEGVFKVLAFAGGGFAGQVYRCVLQSLDLEDDRAREVGLREGNVYAVKVLLPPSRAASRFRDFVYRLGFQAPFSARVQEIACRCGLLWPKVLRLAASDVFGTPEAIADTYASFYDANLKSYGEVREWVEGRVWRLEADLEPWKRRPWKTVDPLQSQSPEYVAKRQFMARLVDMMHQMGAPELARQYAWSTMKSQPNVLKRDGANQGPSDGLCAVDFRAGLALLPFLPMSPGDIRLIGEGLLRGSLVQFDRCDYSRLRAYVEAHPQAFKDHGGLIEALKRYDDAYRRTMPDLTHQGWRLLVDRTLRADVKSGCVVGYSNSGLIDPERASLLLQGQWRFTFFYLAGALPLIGRLGRRLWGRLSYRKHLKALWTNADYFRRHGKATAAATAIRWIENGRVGDQHALYLADHVAVCWVERLLLGWMPAVLHRTVCDPMERLRRLWQGCCYVHRFLTNAGFRQQWLLKQIDDGEREGMLTDEESTIIRSQVSDPFIAKYLKSVGVHLAFIPVTQIVSLTVGAIVALREYASSGDAYAAGIKFGAVLLLFQAMPISPGSIFRGLYVVYLMIRERNFRDYAVAAPLSFVKYIGYLAFPVQMAAKYPVLSQFMAGRWATAAVRRIPVFGEKGALLEHGVFDVCFNRTRLLGHFLSRHAKCLLNGWMVTGLLLGGLRLGVSGVAWSDPAGMKSGMNTLLAVVCLFVLPRVLFYPLLRKPLRDT